MASSKLNLYGELFRNSWSSWFVRGTSRSQLSVVGRQILLRFFVSGLNAWTVVVVLFFVHEEYLGAVDMTSHVGTIPTAGLASYFLV